MVVASSSNGAFGILRTAFNTTPGPLTPTFKTTSGSPTPWKAPAINGLSSTALQNTTSLALPRPSLSAVSSALSFTISPIRRTASILIPARLEPTFTDAHTKSVSASARGIERISFSSPFVMPFCTKAEKPPMKFTPTSFAAASKVFAILT